MDDKQAVLAVAGAVRGASAVFSVQADEAIAADSVTGNANFTAD